MKRRPPAFGAQVLTSGSPRKFPVFFCLFFDVASRMREGKRNEAELSTDGL